MIRKSRACRHNRVQVPASSTLVMSICVSFHPLLCYGCKTLPFMLSDSMGILKVDAPIAAFHAALTQLIVDLICSKSKRFLEVNSRSPTVNSRRSSALASPIV